MLSQPPKKTTYLASGLSDPPVLTIILYFHGRLALSYSPQVPPEHNQDCESDYTGQAEHRDKYDLGRVIVPIRLKRFATSNE